MVCTSNIFVMHLQTFMKAYLTSWEMVAADGIGIQAIQSS